MRNAAVLLLLTISMKAQGNVATAFPDAAELQQMARRFAPTPLKVDIGRLDSGDRKALIKLIKAGRAIDDIFLQQLWSGNEKLYGQLRQDTSPLGKAWLHMFWINKGPWSDLDAHRAFLPGVPERKPLGANFYPEDLTREEFEHWIAGLPEEEAEQAKSFFTVIRRDPQARHLETVPYHREYREDLRTAANLLRQAAALTENTSLRRFLETRATAFLNDDYYESDLAWMDVDAPVDITLGPYETYNDELFGYKAAFEAYICVRDDVETDKLKDFSRHLQEVENNLPLDPAYRNPKLGATTPIRVVNEVLSAGDDNHGVRTAAFNLPNDERVIQQKGSKKVMLKNVQHAKFEGTLVPISRIVLPGSAQPELSFDWFFTHILAHELSHGIGPHEIKISGKTTSVRHQLKNFYSTVEEAKADVTGLFMVQFFFDKGVLRGGEENERKLYNTFLASSFRTLRFGITEAHGRGMAVQFNYFMQHGAFVARPDGTFEVNYAKVKQAVRDLTHDLLTIEAHGDYAAAKRMLEELGVMQPALARALDRLKGIPVDIEPLFVTADELTGRQR
ncbi:MAG: dipeptidyl-peptidase 3 family protein [Bryobacteraceae bacterium]